MRVGTKFALGLLLVLGVGAITFGLLNWTAQPRPHPSHPPARAPAAALASTLPAPDPLPPPPVEPAGDSSEPTPLANLRPEPRPASPNPRPRIPDTPPEPTEPPVAAALDTTPPLLKVLAPQGHAVIMTPKLLLRVKSEAGARVTVNGQALAENSPGLFAVDWNLQAGRNELALVAEDAAGNRTRARVLATFVDPERFQQNKERFLALMGQLDEIQAAAADLDGRIEELITRLDDPEQADRVSALSQELRGIRNTRRELEQEVGRAITEIDQLLRK